MSGSFNDFSLTINLDGLLAQSTVLSMSGGKQEPEIFRRLTRRRTTNNDGLRFAPWRSLNRDLTFRGLISCFEKTWTGPPTGLQRGRQQAVERRRLTQVPGRCGGGMLRQFPTALVHPTARKRITRFEMVQNACSALGRSSEHAHQGGSPLSKDIFTSSS
jgi:hypothetical protein